MERKEMVGAQFVGFCIGATIGALGGFFFGIILVAIFYRDCITR